MKEIIITSTVLIAALLLLRRLCWNRISRRLQYGLWLLVAIRLLVPAELLTSPISVMQLVDWANSAWQENLQEEESQEARKNSELQEQASGEYQEVGQQGLLWTEEQQGGQLWQEGQQPVLSTPSQEGVLTIRVPGQNAIAQGKSTANDSQQLSDEMRTLVITMFQCIYIIGVLGMGSVLLGCNIRFRRRLCRTRSLIGQEGALKVYLAEELDSPCMCGVFRPAIYINRTGHSNETYKKHILMHEMTHYRHGDHIWTLVRSLCLVLYWFHPLVWVAAAISARDGELACDEGTLKRLGDGCREAYGRTLIEMTTGGSSGGSIFYCATGMINHKKEIRQRIVSIANHKKPLLWTTLAAIPVIVLLAACTAGDDGKEAVREQTSSQTPEVGNGQEGSQQEQASGDSQEGSQQGQATFPSNEDGSYRLSEYKVDLNGDKAAERIVFDVYYWADLEKKGKGITEDLLWQELWTDCEVVARVLTGADEQVLWEHSYSDAHAGNGNLAIIRYEKKNCLMQYGNWVGQGAGDFYYQILQLGQVGEKPVILEEKNASYKFPIEENDEMAIEAVLETAEELDKYLTSYNTEIMVNATVTGRESCYLYGDSRGLLNGVRRQTAFDLFMTEVSGNGWELNLRDYFYPEGMESLTVLPEDAEARIRAGEILCMEVSPDNATAGRLDLDGDGQREVIALYALSDWFGGSGWEFWSEDHGIIDEHYRIRVNGKYCEGYCDIMDPVVMAYSPDGKQILLALYDDGPSNDPKTLFFRYTKEGLRPAGQITDDLRTVSIDKDRVIRGKIRVDMIQTEWAYGYYIWNGREIVMREDEVFYLLDDSSWRERDNIPLLLLEELTVYAERSEDSQAMVMKPQSVSHVATDRSQWVLLEAADGTKGWLRVERFGRIPQLGNKGSSEVFEGLNMAD